MPRSSLLALYARLRAASRALLLLATLGACKEISEPEPFTITPDVLALLVGESSQLTAVGASESVAWSSSNSQVASVVSVTGFVRAVSRGQATISAVSGSTVATATVNVALPPSLRLSAPSANFSAVIGDPDPAAQTITVDNAGDGAINGITPGTIAYGENQPTGWLTVTASGSTAPVTVTLTARRGTLPRGTYTATVPIQAAGIANSPQSIAVMFLLQAPPSIVVSRASVPMAGIPGATITETVDITNGGDVPLTGLSRTITYTQGASQTWLQATLGATTAPTVLTLLATTTGLAVGNYAATVRVASSLPNVAARDISVTLSVAPGPAIALSTSTVNVSAVFGANPSNQTITVTNSGGGTLNQLSLDAPTYGPGQTQGWLSPLPTLAATTAPTTITLRFLTASLAAGTYNATVPVRSPVASNNPVNLNVVLVVSLPPVISLSPTSVSFAVWGGATTLPGAQNVLVTNSGGGTLSGLTATIQYNAGASGWLTPTFSGGTTAPTTLQLRPNATSIGAGTHTATVTVSSSIAGVASKTVSVSYTVQTFTVNVLPVFNSFGCAGCHSGGSGPNMSGGSMSIYGQLVPGYVVPGNPDASFLVCKLTLGSGCAHSGGKLSSGGIFTIRAWISGGAPFQ